MDGNNLKLFCKLTGEEAATPPEPLVIPLLGFPDDTVGSIVSAVLPVVTLQSLILLSTSLPLPSVLLPSPSDVKAKWYLSVDLMINSLPLH